ncbi:hypothetical protein PAHAL_5G392100 [Panicum hallii]|uniref:Uncharacterized protein n=1 Tax=Panicum hallii TaxID=206008 RepID=A0A2T8IMM8_9POAL|nr:hypothetical protein PAHAL_5G392100 [Panicum hallii]
MSRPYFGWARAPIFGRPCYPLGNGAYTTAAHSIYFFKSFELGRGCTLVAFIVTRIITQNSLTCKLFTLNATILLEPQNSA